MSVQFPNIGYELSQTDNLAPGTDTVWNWWVADDVTTSVRLVNVADRTNILIKYEEENP